MQNEWFLVAGYYGDSLSEEGAALVVVNAACKLSALKIAGENEVDFKSVSALSESELQSHLLMIDAKRKLAQV